MNVVCMCDVVDWCGKAKS